jgi:isoquinoline 1-oxidoreductase beta subunit
MADFVVEAVTLAGQLDHPVQVVWTREDDMRHDAYRPASLHRLAAALDADGKLIGWKHRITAPSIEAQWRRLEGAPDGFKRGSSDIVYRIPNMHIDCVIAPIPIPIWYWRAVYNNNNAFAGESFLDEIAAATGKDPLALRLELLPEGSRLRGVVEAVADLAGWGDAVPEGRARGFACHECFGSSAAQVAEVSVERGAIRVHRLWCAIDPGVAVHPDGLVAQVEGGVVLGLSEALRGEINFRGGAAVQGNFDEYEPLRMDEAPEVTVRIVESGEPVGGVGEPPVPPAAPAVANAVFAATGKRVRRLPMQKELRRIG